MATHQAKSILTRRRNNDDDLNQDQQPPKIQRFESPDEPAVPPTKIIDLNDDCLMKIFGHLDLNSLFSVAVANEWLRPAAGEIYKRKFGSAEIRVSHCNDYRRNTRANARESHIKETSSTLVWNSHYVVVYGLKACLQFLRCFGGVINDLTIDFDYSRSNRYQYLLQQVNQFCAESLVDVSFEQMPNINMIKQQFQKGFPNITTVQFMYGKLGQQLSSIGECFPNAENLNLINVTMIQQKTDKHLIKKPFEHLKHICIDEYLGGNCSNKTVTNLLEMAHQLENLEIYTYGEAPMNTLLNQIQHNRSVTKLAAFQLWKNTIPMNSDEVRQLISQHPAMNELDLSSYRLNVDDAIAVVHGLNSLQKFHFQMPRADYTHLVNQLDVTWKAEYHPLYVQHRDLVKLKR